MASASSHLSWWCWSSFSPVTHNIYGLVLVVDLKNDYVNSHDFVARLNTKLIEMYGHFALVGVLLLFMELSWAPSWSR